MLESARVAAVAAEGRCCWLAYHNGGPGKDGDETRCG